MKNLTSFFANIIQVWTFPDQVRLNVSHSKTGLGEHLEKKVVGQELFFFSSYCAIEFSNLVSRFY